VKTVGVSRSAANQSWRRQRDRRWRNFAGPCGSETKAIKNDGETETCRLAELAAKDDEKSSTKK
jgi:hypothetical protein